MKKILIIFLTFLFVVSSISVAFADDAKIVADLFILRPLGFATLVGGTTVFVVTLPLTGLLSIANHDTIPKTANALVVNPFNYTFDRPIGENDRDYSEKNK